MQRSLKRRLLDSSPSFVCPESTINEYGSIAPLQGSSTRYCQTNSHDIGEMNNETRITIQDNHSDLSSPASQKNRLTALPLHILLRIARYGSYNDPVLFPIYGSKTAELRCESKTGELRLFIMRLNKVKQSQCCRSLKWIVLLYCQALIDCKLSLLNKVKQKKLAFTAFQTSDINADLASESKARKNEIRQWLSRSDNNRYSIFFKYYCDNVSLVLLIIASVYFFSIFAGGYNYYFVQCMDEDWRHQCVTQKLATELCTMPCNESIVYRQVNDEDFSEYRIKKYYRGCTGGKKIVQSLPGSCSLISMFQNIVYMISGIAIPVFTSVLFSSFLSKTCFDMYSKRMRDKIEGQRASLECIKSFLLGGQLSESEEVTEEPEGAERKEELTQFQVNL